MRLVAGGWKRRLLARVVLYGSFLLIALPWSFSQVLIAPHRQPIGAPPAGYQVITVLSDGLRLRGWLTEGKGERAAVLMAHGIGDSIDSYAEVAAHMRDRGHAVLLLDLRGHGGSEGRHTTLGGLERDDVRAGLAELRRRGLAGHGVILMGWSMGAVSVVRAAVGQPDVRAVVAEAPYDTYRSTVTRHAGLLFHIPAWVPIIPLSIRVAEWRAGFHADDVDAVAASAAFDAPLLAIADGDDRRMPEAVVRRVLDAHRGRRVFWLAPGVGHVGAILRPDYWPHVIGFLEAQGL